MIRVLFPLFIALILALSGHVQVPAVKPLAMQAELWSYQPVSLSTYRFEPLPVTVIEYDAIEQRGFFYRSAISKAAARAYGPGAPVAMLAAQVHVESAFNPTVCSHAGACGIAQFMQPTAEAMARRFPDLPTLDRLDPNWALQAQAYHMAELETRYSFAATPCDVEAFGLSAYNGGEPMLERERKLARDSSSWDSVRIQRVRSPAAFKENRAYVARIQGLIPRYRQLGYPGRGDLCA